MLEKALIVGAGGFIGSTVRNYFDQAGYFRVAPLSSGKVDLSDVCSAVPELSRLTKGSTIVFCAGRHRQRGDDYNLMVQNMNMVESLIEACQLEKPEHIIYLSSVEVYGSPATSPVTEQTKLQPLSLYATGKITCEMMLKVFSNEHNVPLSLLRLPGIYGPSDNGSSIISKLVASARNTRPFKLFGDGSDLRDYVYAKDLAALIHKIAKNKVGTGALNVATGHSISLSSIIELVSEVHGPISVDKTDMGEIHFDLDFDVGKLRRLMPEIAFSSLEKGIRAYG